MPPSRLRSNPTLTASGFTLIELVIAVAIVGIIVALALPAFTGSIRKGRRTEAFTALSAVQQAQERWRVNQPSYATNDQLTLAVSANPPGLGLAANTPSGYYGIAITSVDNTSYTVTATAIAGKSQAADAGCQVLAVRMSGGNLTYGSGVTGVDFAASNPDPNRCWVR